MAEAAAPAAPAPSTSAPTAPAAPAQPATGGSEAPASAPPAEARVLKPIPSLPGVFPDEPIDARPPDSPAGERTRGPDGRFLASPSPPVAGEHASDRRDTSAVAPTAPFEFGGEKFDSQAAAEQNFKSLRGQFKPLQAVAKHLGGVDKILPHMAQAADSARAWKAEHDRVLAELNALRGGSPANPGASPSPKPSTPAPEADADTVDWELYAEVKKLATESGEPWKAEQWLIEQVRKGERARTERLLEEKFAPITAAQSKLAFVAQTESLFEKLSSYTNEDGSPAFPELHDEAAAREVGRLWVSLGLPPETALTPQGAIAAIGMYRMRQPRPQAGPTSAPAPAALPPPPATPADTRIAAGLTDGRPMAAMSVGDGATPSAEAARILAGLRQVNNGSRTHLGFDP